MSKLSSKGQVTIPKEVRRALGLKTGDFVGYEVREEVVELKRVSPFDAEFHRSLSATLDEWESPEDEEAFRDL